MLTRIIIFFLMLVLLNSCYGPTADYKAKQATIQETSKIMREFCTTNTDSNKDWLVANIYFQDNAVTLNSQDKKVLDEVINLHRRCTSTMLIIGHASNFESKQGIPLATSLSYYRAEAVAQYFLQNQVSNKYPKVYFCGNNRNAVVENVATAKDVNQRVEIVFVRNPNLQEYNQQLCLVS